MTKALAEPLPVVDAETVPREVNEALLHAIGGKVRDVVADGDPVPRCVNELVEDKQRETEGLRVGTLAEADGDPVPRCVNELVEDKQWEAEPVADKHREGEGLPVRMLLGLKKGEGEPPPVRDPKTLIV